MNTNESIKTVGKFEILEITTYTDSSTNDYRNPLLVATVKLGESIYETMVINWEGKSKNTNDCGSDYTFFHEPNCFGFKSGLSAQFAGKRVYQSTTHRKMGNFHQVYPLLPTLPLPHAHTCMPITKQDSGAKFEVPNSAIPAIYENEQNPFQAFKRDRDQLIKILQEEVDNFAARMIAEIEEVEELLRIQEEEFVQMEMEELIRMEFIRKNTEEVEKLIREAHSCARAR